MRDDYRKYDDQLRGFSGGHDRFSVYGFIKWVRETQSFNHLSDDVIRGWLRGRYEIKVIGRRIKSTAYYVDVTCSKCKGRGWFGHGRKDCPECVAIGKETTWKERRWKGGYKFKGEDKRGLILSEKHLGFIDTESSEVKYARAYVRAADHHEHGYPGWVDDIHISGDYSDKQKADYLELIKSPFRFRVDKPKVKWESHKEFKLSHYNIDTDETIVRLAMTFGCTCPITGEYVPPSQVSTIKEHIRHWDMYDYKYEVGYDYHNVVAPLGFSESVSTWWFKPCGNKTYFNCASPFSKRGKKIIDRAATKCLKAMDGKLDKEWVLAEVMQSCILKRAA